MACSTTRLATDMKSCGVVVLVHVGRANGRVFPDRAPMFKILSHGAGFLKLTHYPARRSRGVFGRTDSVSRC